MHTKLGVVLAIRCVFSLLIFIWMLAPCTVVAQPSGQPFTQLTNQMAALQSQIQAMQAQIETMQTALDESQLALQEQNSLLATLERRMIFENGSWVGWRDMRLHGTTHFTHDDDASQVWIHQSNQPVVQIVTPYSAATHGKRVALKATGHTQLISTDASSTYHPSLEVVGPAWFKQAPNGEHRFTVNGGGNPNWAVHILGPAVFVDENLENAQHRSFSVFAWPNFPLQFTRLYEAPDSQLFTHSMFSVQMPPLATQATVWAGGFAEIQP